MKQSDLFHLFRFDYTSTLMCAILLFLSLDLFLKKLLCSFAPKIIKAFATDLLPLVKFKNLVIAKSMLHIRIATKKKVYLCIKYLIFIDQTIHSIIVQCTENMKQPKSKDETVPGRI